jgi:hypothetical protein
VPGYCLEVRLFVVKDEVAQDGMERGVNSSFSPITLASE